MLTFGSIDDVVEEDDDLVTEADELVLDEKVVLDDEEVLDEDALEVVFIREPDLVPNI